MRLVTGQRLRPLMRLLAPFNLSFRTFAALSGRRGNHKSQPTLIPSPMVTPGVYDISPQHSALGYLGRNGHDVWVFDFGVPKVSWRQERTLDDYIIAINTAIDEIVSATGGPVHLAGYLLGASSSTSRRPTESPRTLPQR